MWGLFPDKDDDAWIQFQCEDSISKIGYYHYKDKTVLVRPSYHYNESLYTANIAS